MQPYFLPYIGYFTLINAVDKFVYLDDVQYIRRGWVNRNRVKMGNSWLYLTIPVKKALLKTNLNEVHITDDEKIINRLKKTIKHCYNKTPNYGNIEELIFKHLKSGDLISKININLSSEICKYLEIDTIFKISSEIKKDNDLYGKEKIIEICKRLGCNNYINPIGGIELYDKEEFKKKDIRLNFIKMNEIRYYQGHYNFIKDLSIIDLMMWNSKFKIKEMLLEYKLI